jgi:hypothetical protein
VYFSDFSKFGSRTSMYRQIQYLERALSLSINDAFSLLSSDE